MQKLSRLTIKFVVGTLKTGGGWAPFKRTGSLEEDQSVAFNRVLPQCSSSAAKRGGVVLPCGICVVDGS